MAFDSLRAYLVFCSLRVINALLIQSQFDPDEYWQNLEPAYCSVFEQTGTSCPGLTWEWKRRPASTEIDSFDGYIASGLEGPLRSYASILPTLLLYYLVKYLGVDYTWVVSKGPILLNAILVSAPTDLAVWYMARYLQSPKERNCNTLAWWCSFCSLTSWFNAYALIRTYSNSIETALLAISFALVSPVRARRYTIVCVWIFEGLFTHFFFPLSGAFRKELLGNENGRRSSLPRAFLAFFLGGICCSVRFTCLAAFVPMGLILAFQRRCRSLVFVVGYVVGICAAPGIAGLFLTLLLDRYVYGFWAFPLLGNIQFNILEGNGSLYGTHPFHWYITAGIPAIAGLLLPLLVLDFFGKWSHARRNIWIVCLVYITAHSYSEHKEFRFLLPLLSLFCLLCGPRLRALCLARRSCQLLLISFAVLNLGVVIYLGQVHQRAPLDVNREIVRLVKHEPQTYTIHYLMGCHSTPLLSHLHTPPIKFETWTLDCSPECRANPDVECESELFSRDPGMFMEEAYFHCSDFEEGTCVTDLRIFYPDFLVANSENVPQMQSRISNLGMKEVGRFTNGINGIQLASSITFGKAAFADNTFTKIELFSELVVLSLDEIVLFKNKDVHPRY